MALPVVSNSDSRWDDDEWEVCNDNGFVYKRRRLQRRATGAEDVTDADPEAELRRHRRSRKKSCLLALKSKYLKELEQWEDLSSSLSRLTSEKPYRSPSFHSNSDAILLSSPPPPPPPLSPINELLFQAEAQELILGKLRDLCDYVDSVCTADEERMVESLIDLPIWGSPRSLVASLSVLQ